MKTPIADFVKRYNDSGVSRLHMPGHKGKGPLGVEQFDITEVQGADALYSAEGIIDESETNASVLFGSAHTYYSTEGSSLCIKAMLAIALNGKVKLILAARNVHKSFLYGAALLDLKVDWLYPEQPSHICSCTVTPDSLRRKLESMPERPSAVYVTSPDYLGNVQDIKGLSAVCREFGVPLLVDNAHGAYMRFLENSRHPIDLGADMCCDSAHKTLPVLTGGAYLHISKTAPNEYLQNARRFLSVFASTSPSYLILQSLDLCNRYLSDGYSEALNNTCKRVAELKKALSDSGWRLCGDEPLKVTVDCKESGYSGEQVSEVLRKFSVEPEFNDRDVVVLMFTPETDEKAMLRIIEAFKSLTPKLSDTSLMPQCRKAQAVMSIRKALFSEQSTVSVNEASGRVCAAPLVACPPAVPPVMSGELITAEVVEILKYCGIKKIDVVN